MPLFSNLFGGDAGLDLKAGASIGPETSGDAAAGIAASLGGDGANGPDAVEVLPVGDAPFLQDFGRDASIEGVARADAEVGSIISTMTDAFVDDFGLLP